MNRNYYCKVNSQKEADELLKKLKDIGEDIDRYNYTKSWQYIVYDINTSWALYDIKNWKEEFENRTEVPAPELIDYVTGKKLDKDALLEEAKRRYPVGTKFKSALKGDKHPFQTIVKENIYLDKVDGRQVIWNGDSCGFIYDDGNWAEIVEEPKVETKEEFVLPEYWFLRFKTKEVFDELCKKYAPDFIFFENAGICNSPTKLKLGNYYYLTKDTKYGEEITFDQFKKYVLKQEVKSMKEWSVGSYVVWLTQFKEFKIKVGTIDEISEAGDSRGMGSTKLFGSTAFLQRNNKNLKWFPTLQEAQKFSDELLDKSKTSLSVEDLIEGEFYRHNENGNIFKWAKNKQFYLGDSQTSFEYADGCWEGPFSLANASEVKWLKTCIKQDKFIEQSELDKYDDEGNLMESEEYPEYVECINVDGDLKVGNIYKVIKCKLWDCESTTGCGYVYYFEHSPKTPYYTEYFKPSTKSAYDAQKENNEWIKEASIRYSLNSWVEDLYGNAVIITNNWYVLEDKLFNNSSLISIKIE